MALKIIISQDGTDKDRFDREYYCKNHIRRVRQVWEPFGLLDIGPFFPAIESDKKGTIRVSQCVFRDRAAMEAAFAAQVIKELMADIPDFTDLPQNSYILAPMRDCSREDLDGSRQSGMIKGILFRLPVAAYEQYPAWQKQLIPA